MSIVGEITVTIELSEPVITEHSPGVYACAFTMKHPKGETAFTVLVDDEGVPIATPAATPYDPGNIVIGTVTVGEVAIDRIPESACKVSYR